MIMSVPAIQSALQQLQVLAGQVIGAYVGAKFTRMAPQLLLKSCMVLLPALGGIILLLSR